MDTAPRDGTWILVWRNGAPSIASWNAQKHHIRPKPYWASDGGRTFSDRAHAPEGWLPLPKQGPMFKLE
jgi:hypothetical protein